MATTLLELGPWRLIHGWLAAVAILAVLWSCFVGGHGQKRRRWADVAVAWLLWHWFTGGRLDPERSFPRLDQADEDVDEDVDEADGAGRAMRVAARAGLAVARTVAAGAVVAGEYVRSGAPHGTGPLEVAASGVAGAVAVAAVTVLIVHLAVRAAHWVRWVRPLHLAVHKAAGWDEKKVPSRYLRVPRDRAEGSNESVLARWRHPARRRVTGSSDGVIVKLPPTFDLRQAHKDQIVQIVRDKLALADVSVTWGVSGRHSYVQFRPRKQMPARAFFSDPEIRRLVEKAKPSAPVLGVTRGGTPVAVDLDVESPHVLISAGTGGGKSSTIQTIAAQLMWHGADAVIIDYKRHSHMWASGLAGVRYARDLGEIHRTLVEVGAEGQRRNLAWDGVGLDDQGPTFTRKLVVCEELNATTSMLRQWWKDNREPGDPLTSPAITALGQLLFMGRAVRIHVLAVAQMATAKDMGGPEMRENYAVRILARHTANAWKMLVPECTFVPASRHPGRAVVCIGGIATETQMVYFTPHQARAWVADRRGLQPVDVADVAGRSDPVSLGKQVATVAAPVLDEGEPVTLAEASNDRGRAVVDLSWQALRKAAERDPEFPPLVAHRGQARLYSPTALQRWETNRPVAKGNAE